MCFNIDEHNQKILFMQKEKEKIDAMLKRQEEIEQKLSKIYDFEIPPYIIDDIALSEKYEHTCLLINMAVLNNSMTKENATILKSNIEQVARDVNKN